MHNCSSACSLDLVSPPPWTGIGVYAGRLLDIIACTTSFGQSEKQQQKVETSSSSSSVGTKIPSAGITTEPQGENQLEASSKLSASNEEEEFIISNNNSSSSSRKGILNSKNEAIAAMAAAKEATEKGDITGMCSPSSKLGQFYEFLSFSHLIPPLQFVRWSLKQSVVVVDHNKQQECDFFVLDVRLCNGKLVTVTAGEKGFYSCSSKQLIHCHSLVLLLKRLSKAFANAYSNVMKAITERNKVVEQPCSFCNTLPPPPPRSVKLLASSCSC
ncbi:unnamed protein product [Sphagnum compactum]